MILTAAAIRELQEKHNVFEPFMERTKHESGCSGGLSFAGYDIHIAQNLILGPGEFSLASSLERFQVPNTVLLLVKDKSTHARRGISVFNTVIEPGWCGYLTLEIVNHSQKPVTLKAGTPIAQVLFEATDRPAESYDGKYQNQEARPYEAILERGE